MSVEYVVYRKEILDFLRTVTIKFVPFADLMAKNLLLNYGIEVSKDEDNPYYLNLAGQYHRTDAPMYVTAIETGQEILFSRENLIEYPKTAALYRIPNKEYLTLCQRYPAQTGLIRGIVYPARDLATAIAAENLTILHYDRTLLHSNEQESLLTAMQEFLDMYESRWYVPDYNYEELYPVVYWGGLWNLLPQVLLAQRVRNLRTNAVHPMHIWEYLTSKGLANYRDILNDRQSLFLYRNINYLETNKGKMSTLKILADHLLRDMHITLVGKKVIQQTEARADDCMTVPEFISEEVVDYSTQPVELEEFASMDTMIHRMYQDGLERRADAEYVEEVEERFGYTPMNILPTKLLELRKNVVSTRYEETLCQFVFDSFMYKFAAGKLSYKISFIDELSAKGLTLTPGEAVALFHYVYFRHTGELPTLIPTKFQPILAYQMVKPSIPVIFPTKEYDYLLRSFVAVEKVVQEIPWDNLAYGVREDYLHSLAEQFAIMMKHTRQVRSSADLRYHRAMQLLYDQFLFQELVEFQLVPYRTYQEWIDATPWLQNLLKVYEENTATKQEAYWNLGHTLIEQLLPLDQDSLFDPYLGVTKDKTAIYAGLKELFIQLCSYNVAFLETDRSKYFYLFMDPLCMEFEDITTRWQEMTSVGLEGATEIDRLTFLNELSDLAAAHLGEYNQETLQLAIDVSPEATEQAVERPLTRIRTDEYLIPLSNNEPARVAVQVGCGFTFSE